ncbi:hypothetical protein JR316_0007527 [Psilocybe cubensis]|uniref:Uncharacterized protein n=2 Tax=Psilocybe cubensis TaxID=181762 RepID=A0ACB8GZB6_PSICU|nr:hypothetical protein JR316_0007527 [Psilocybe cubensis]KAH9480924.1 hypothetical protein JR316_0007527 [Psilocybe cubensis]
MQPSSLSNDVDSGDLAASPAGEGDLLKEIQERLQKSGMDGGLINGEVSGGALLLINDLAHEVGKLRTRNAILAQELRGTKRSCEDNESETEGGPSKRLARTISDQEQAKAVNRRLRVISGVKVPGPLLPKPRIIKDTSNDVAPLQQEDEELVPVPPDSDGEFSPSGRQRSRKEMVTYVHARRQQRERAMRRNREIEDARRRAEMEFTGRTPDLFGVVHLPRQAPQRDNTLRGMALASTYISTRSNTVFVRSTALLAEKWERKKPSAYRASMGSNRHNVYEKAPHGFPESPFEATQLVKITQDVRVPPWVRVEAYTLLDIFRDIAGRVIANCRDRTMNYVLTIALVDYIPDVDKSYFAKTAIARDPRKLEAAAHDISPKYPSHHRLLEIDDLGRSILLYGHPGGVNPIVGAILNMMFGADRRSVFGYGLSRMLSPADRNARTAFVKQFAIIAAHSNLYREGIRRFNADNPGKEFRPQSGPTYRFTRCEIDPDHIRNMSTGLVIDVLINNGIPPEWIDHAYNFGFQYFNQKHSGTTMDESLYADIDNERLRRLDAFGEPAPIAEWDGWRPATEGDRIRLALILEQEEGLQPPRFSLRDSGWLLAGQPPTSRFLVNRPDPMIVEPGEAPALTTQPTPITSTAAGASKTPSANAPEVEASLASAASSALTISEEPRPHSANAPEKVLLVTIRDKGLCPCPTCLVPKSKLDQLGLKRDKNLRTDNRTVCRYIVEQVALARDAIYCLGHSIKSEVVDRLLKPFSGVPTENAFVARLGLDFNPSDMLTVDLLHEFEIGVWKSLFTHLIRLLYAARGGSDELVTELDRRYRQVSTFGNGTIRNFAENSSEMKKLAARNFEDLLQCAIPIFEGLFPDPHNRQISKLLYRTAEWHGLAKMRIHTEGSLKLLDELTFEFGKLMREFRDKQRRQAQKQASTVENNAPAKAPLSRRSIKFNLNTPKFHFLGDYVRHIRNFGTTDSYSTQLSEVAHRLLKSLYKLTNKKDANKQIAQKYSRMMALQSTMPYQQDCMAERAEAAVSGHLQDTHYISKSRNTPVPIFAFMQNDTDPAKKNFLHLLKNHLLGRLTGRTFDGDDTDSLFDDEDCNNLQFINNTMFRVNTMRTYYTTYDMRRAYDTISTRSHPFVMVLSPETEPGAHPFWYASVIGVFHADVQHTGPKSRNCSPKRVEFLWVRWLGVEPGYKSGRKLACLPKIGFVVEDDEFAFGFLDPSLVVRGCHLLPSFVDGRTNELLRTTGPTQARPPQETDDWMNYYVNIFVDRDMLSRYLGIGIGHQEASGRFQFEEPSDIAEELEAAEDDGPGCPDDMSDDSESDNEDIDSHSANEDFDDDTVDNDDLGFNDL